MKVDQMDDKMAASTVAMMVDQMDNLTAALLDLMRVCWKDKQMAG